MKKQGSVAIYGFMLSIVILVLALALSPVVRDFTVSAMNASVADTIGMDCDNTTDNFVKAACVATDLSLFYFIGVLIFMGGVVATAKIVFGGSE